MDNEVGEVFLNLIYAIAELIVKILSNVIFYDVNIWIIIKILGKLGYNFSFSVWYGMILVCISLIFKQMFTRESITKQKDEEEE
jgi:hypothetical protein